jgi:acetate kinase
MSGAILVLNSGSSSIKFGLYALTGKSDPNLLCKGLLDEHDATPRLTIKDVSGNVVFDQPRHRDDNGNRVLLTGLLEWIDAYLTGDRLLAIGHRVVHGGRDFVTPVEVTDAILDALFALTPLAPMHQPSGLSPIRTLRSHRPGLRQIACFDTAYHRRLAPPVNRYALPRRYEAIGIHRYGFHGLSYEFIAGCLTEISPALASKRTVVAHLGSGSSLCAMRQGTSVDTTMGLTPLDGLMMATRCGAIDPGVLLYLQQGLGMSVGDIEHLLYNKSGLLGVSELSGDMRVLLASADPRAAEAIDLFCLYAAREVTVMANALDGLECLVFTGGIGEHSIMIRQKLCDRLQWLGVQLDMVANDRGNQRISKENSPVEIRIIPTNEEIMIARHCLEML